MGNGIYTRTQAERAEAAKVRKGVTVSHTADLTYTFLLCARYRRKIFHIFGVTELFRKKLQEAAEENEFQIIEIITREEYAIITVQASEKVTPNAIAIAMKRSINLLIKQVAKLSGMERLCTRNYLVVTGDHIDDKVVKGFLENQKKKNVREHEVHEIMDYERQEHMVYHLVYTVKLAMRRKDRKKGWKDIDKLLLADELHLAYAGTTEELRQIIYGDYEMELIVRSTTERKPYWIQMEAMNRVQTIMKEMTEQPPILKECHIETMESGFW